MDRYDRTVTIPIKIIDGKIMCEDGKPIPKFSKNAFGELLIPSIFLSEKEDIEKYREKEKKHLNKKSIYILS